MAWKWLVEDHAVSALVAEISLIGLAVVISAALMAVYHGHPEGSPAAAVALVHEPTANAQTRSFVIASAIPRLEWAGIEVALEDAPLPYDAALSADPTWCVVVEGAACAVALGDARVTAGQQLRVRDASASGAMLTLRQAETNALLHRAPLR